MSLGSQFARLSKRSAGMRQEMFGESITIWTLDESVSLRLKANISIGPSAQTLTEGGFYQQDAMTAEILASDIANFPLEAEMPVTAREKAMRIAPDGITPGTINYRLVLIPRHAPRHR